jgi:hypothetical protein
MSTNIDLGNDIPTLARGFSMTKNTVAGGASLSTMGLRTTRIALRMTGSIEFYSYKVSHTFAIKS